MFKKFLILSNEINLVENLKYFFKKFQARKPIFDMKIQYMKSITEIFGFPFNFYGSF